MWQTSYIPSQWKETIVVPILKPDKPASDPNSYRPISLTSCFSKLIERMITNRLTWYLNKHNIITHNQSGFRKHHSTTDHLLKLSDHIHKAINTKQHTLAVFLDIQKAYDMLWKEGLLVKLHTLGIQGHMFNWIKNFLSNRKIQVKVNNTLSNSLHIQNGVPQGSVISPILFLVMINDTPLPKHSSLFADDIAFWDTHKNTKFLGKQIQQQLDKIIKWGKDWGITFSPTKTNSVLFTKSKLPSPTLYMDHSAIPTSNKAKFLGLTFDKTLSWIPHINNITNKLTSTINILKHLTGYRWGANKKSLLKVYRACIKSLLNYGAPAFHNASKTALKKLDLIQSKCLRIINNSHLSTPIAAMQASTGEPPLDIQRTHQIIKYGINSLTYNIPTKHSFLDSWHQYFTKKQNFTSLYNIVKEFIQYEDIQILLHKQHPNPPWHIASIDTDTTIAKLITKSDIPAHIRNTALQHLTSYTQHLKIFTDGSKQGSKTACAYSIPELKNKKSFALPDNTSIFSAELYAILQATHFIRDMLPLSVVILTDSLSAIQAIEAQKDQPLIKEILLKISESHKLGSQVSICWIPAHCGIAGNESADAAAKDGIHLPNKCHLPPSLSDNYQTILKFTLQLWQNKYNNTNINSVYKTIVPNVSFKTIFNHQNRYQESLLTSFIHGVPPLNKYKHKVNLAPSPNCPHCHQTETIEHYIYNCPQYHTHRQTLLAQIQRANIQPTLQNLLTNKNITKHTLSYISKTKRFT